MTQAQIKLTNVSVSYFLKKGRNPDLAVQPGSVGAQIIIGKRYLEVAALKNIDLTIEEGERVGLIGVNGSGKTTLLKLCAGALSPQVGTLEISGTVSAQFSLGAGLRASLSGRQNARLKCLYMGIPQSRITALIEEVKRLSGLGGFFELPMQSYSAGMKSRFVMSFLPLVRGEILIMDEWINAKDTSVDGIQQRLVGKAKILLLASHSKPVLDAWVDRLVWLDRGELRAVGRVDEVYGEYRDFVLANKKLDPK